MLEHSAMYLNVTPPYEEETSFFPDFYSTRLGQCELQDPVWAKMSALAAGVNKKRKKSEAKPQAQINKCNNEKRRREQENIYIEELAELISANFADMSSLSVKPDKCAILQEAVNQIRSIKQQETAAPADPVQQGEVSSSRPTILSNEVYGPLLLEALEGFLFVVNSEGKVEHVTENVCTYIRYTREDVLGKSIYNFIHHGDHAKFHSNLLPMTIEWGNDQQIANRSKSIDIRLLVKPPDDLEESVEEKQQRVSRYELMHISSTQLRDQLSVSEEDGSDSGPCLLCVASRISHRDKANCSIEQFTTKLDTSGKVICVDASGVAEAIAQYLKNELKNRSIRDLVHQQELVKINAHLRETLASGQATSGIYRLQIGQDKSIQVQTKSKLFKTNLSNDTDFIMSTHSIIGENDTGGPTDPGGGGTNNPSTTGVGGPLMTSVANGSRNGPPTCPATDPASASSNALLNPTPNPAYSAFALDNEFNFDIFPSSTWELESASWQETPRSDSRHSATPTPRPPSNPSYNAPAYGGFAFSPLTDQGYAMEEQKDTKANVLEEANVMSESNRLRILLTKPQNNNNEGDDKNKDRILKELLNQQDEDSGRNDSSRGSPRGLQSRAMAGPSEPPKTTASSSGNNEMLRQLLNDKSDDDIESRAGMKTKSELLQQLLKPERDGEDDRRSELQCQDDNLMRSLGFPSSPTNERGRKRSVKDRDNKITIDGLQVSSSLQERNKMLAKLLANTPSNHQPIPPIPDSIISATPQEKLPRITDPNKAITMAMSQNAMNNRTAMNRMPGRPSQNSTYMNSAVTPNNIQRNTNQQTNQTSNSYPNAGAANADHAWDNSVQSNDPFLSDLLDQVIEFVPDDIMHMLDGSNNNQLGNFQCSEAVAINNIQKSLMQCENVVKSPVSPNPLAGTPPVYSTTMSNNAFPLPPPNYSQAKFQRIQMRAPQQYANNLNTVLLLRKQQEQKRRLLSQQKQQQLLIPSNAAANEMNSMQNIDSLLNNAVAPNVSLQRSSSAGESMPYSPHAQLTSPLGQQAYPQTTTAGFQSLSARLSPQLQFASQLSPRQGYAQGGAAGAGWQQSQARMSVQQNPMLTAQLTRPPMQSQRSMNSPGSVPTRHSPFANDQFPPPTSPNSAFNSQYLRLQRANSAPTATTQLAGGLGSPRPYTGRDHHPHSYPSIPPHHNVPPMMYQESQYCYDQTGMSLAYNGADRGRAPPHLQTGVSANGPTSEFVRQELRAVVGARTGQAQPPTNRTPSQMLVQQQVSDLEGLGINFEMPSGASDSPKLWGAMGSDMGSMSPQPATSRTTMEEGRQGDQKSSLLQKLLSE